MVLNILTSQSSIRRNLLKEFSRVRSHYSKLEIQKIEKFSPGRTVPSRKKKKKMLQSSTKRGSLDPREGLLNQKEKVDSQK